MACCGRKSGSPGIRSQPLDSGKCKDCGWPLRGVHTYDKETKKLVKAMKCLNRKCTGNKWHPT